MPQQIENIFEAFGQAPPAEPTEITQPAASQSEDYVQSRISRLKDLIRYPMDPPVWEKIKAWQYIEGNPNFLAKKPGEQNKLRTRYFKEDIEPLVPSTGLIATSAKGRLHNQLQQIFVANFMDSFGSGVTGMMKHEGLIPQKEPLPGEFGAINPWGQLAGGLAATAAAAHVAGLVPGMAALGKIKGLKGVLGPVLKSAATGAIIQAPAVLKDEAPPLSMLKSGAAWAPFGVEGPLGIIAPGIVAAALGEEPIAAITGNKKVDTAAGVTLLMAGMRAAHIGMERTGITKKQVKPEDQRVKNYEDLRRDITSLAAEYKGVNTKIPISGEESFEKVQAAKIQRVAAHLGYEANRFRKNLEAMGGNDPRFRGAVIEGLKLYELFTATLQKGSLEEAHLAFELFQQQYHKAVSIKAAQDHIDPEVQKQAALAVQAAQTPKERAAATAEAGAVVSDTAVIRVDGEPPVLVTKKPTVAAALRDFAEAIAPGDIIEGKDGYKYRANADGWLYTLDADGNESQAFVQYQRRSGEGATLKKEVVLNNLGTEVLTGARNVTADELFTPKPMPTEVPKPAAGLQGFIEDIRAGDIIEDAQGNRLEAKADGWLHSLGDDGLAPRPVLQYQIRRGEGANLTVTAASDLDAKAVLTGARNLMSEGRPAAEPGGAAPALTLDGLIVQAKAAGFIKTPAEEAAYRSVIKRAAKELKMTPDEYVDQIEAVKMGGEPSKDALFKMEEPKEPLLTGLPDGFIVRRSPGRDIEHLQKLGVDPALLERQRTEADRLEDMPKHLRWTPSVQTGPHTWESKSTPKALEILADIDRIHAELMLQAQRGIDAADIASFKTEATDPLSTKDKHGHTTREWWAIAKERRLDIGDWYEVVDTSTGEVHSSAGSRKDAIQEVLDYYNNAPQVIEGLEERPFSVPGAEATAPAKVEKPWLKAPRRTPGGPGFYDSIVYALESWQDAGARENLASHLAKFPGATTEAKQIGLDKWLAKRPRVTKQQVLNEVARRSVDVRTIVKTEEASGELRKTNEQMEKLYDARRELTQDRNPDIGLTPEERSTLASLNRRIDVLHKFRRTLEGTTARYGKKGYTVADEKNYKEILLTFEPKSIWQKNIEKGGGAGEEDVGSAAYIHYEEAPIVFTRASEPLVQRPGQRLINFMETQSDLHQAGRKHGYATGPPLKKLPAGYKVVYRETARWDVGTTYVDEAIRRELGDLHIKAQAARPGTDLQPVYNRMAALEMKATEQIVAGLEAEIQGQTKLVAEIQSRVSPEHPTLSPEELTQLEMWQRWIKRDSKALEEINRTDGPTYPGKYEVFAEGVDTTYSDENLSWGLTRREAVNSALIDLNSRLTPDVPFKETAWMKLIARKQLQWVVDNGFDRVGFATGAQQQQRWGSEAVAWRKLPDNRGWEVEAIGWTRVAEPRVGKMTDKDLAVQPQKTVVRTKEELATFISKGPLVTDSVAATAPGENPKNIEKVWQRMQTQAEGNWMYRAEGQNYFYNKEYIDIVNKIVKPWNAKVDSPLTAKSDFQYLTVSPEMKNYISEYQLPLFKTDEAKVFRASIERNVETGKALIRALESPTFSHFIHETGHDFLDRLPSTQRTLVEKWAGLEPGAKFSEASAEKFANAAENAFKGLPFEKGMHPEVQGVFAHFKEWLRSIFTYFSKEAKVSREMEGLFKRVFGPEEVIAAKLRTTLIPPTPTEAETFRQEAAGMMMKVDRTLPGKVSSFIESGLRSELGLNHDQIYALTIERFPQLKAVFSEADRLIIRTFMEARLQDPSWKPSFATWLRHPELLTGIESGPLRGDNLVAAQQASIISGTRADTVRPDINLTIQQGPVERSTQGPVRMSSKYQELREPSNREFNLPPPPTFEVPVTKRNAAMLNQELRALNIRAEEMHKTLREVLLEGPTISPRHAEILQKWYAMFTDVRKLAVPAATNLAPLLREYRMQARQYSMSEGKGRNPIDIGLLLTQKGVSNAYWDGGETVLVGGKAIPLKEIENYANSGTTLRGNIIVANNIGAQYSAVVDSEGRYALQTHTELLRPAKSKRMTGRQLKEWSEINEGEVRRILYGTTGITIQLHDVDGKIHTTNPATGERAILDPAEVQARIRTANSVPDLTPEFPVPPEPSSFDTRNAEPLLMDGPITPKTIAEILDTWAPVLQSEFDFFAIDAANRVPSGFSGAPKQPGERMVEPAGPQGPVKSLRPFFLFLRKGMVVKDLFANIEQRLHVPLAKAWTAVEGEFRTMGRWMHKLYPELSEVQKYLKQNPLDQEFALYLGMSDKNQAGAYLMKKGWAINGPEHRMLEKLGRLFGEAFGPDYQTFMREHLSGYISLKSEVHPELAPWLRNGLVPQFENLYTLLNNAAHTRMRLRATPFLKDMQNLVEDMKNRADIPIETRFKVQEEVNGYIRAKAYSLTPDKATLTAILEYMNTELGLDLTGSVPSQVVSHMLMTSRMATMGFRLGTAIRNGFQPFFTVYPILGAKYLGKGIARSFTPEGKALAERIGLKEGEAAPQEAHLPRKTLPGVREAHDASMLMFKLGEYGTRSVASNAGWAAFMEEGARLFKGEIDLVEFKRNSGIIFLEKAYQEQVMAPLRKAFEAEDPIEVAGHLEKGAEEFARNFMEDTHWINRVGNSPGIFRSTAGRLLGQYGVYPLSYVNWIRKGLTTGDPKATIAFVTRALAVNAAFAAVGSQVLGVNLSNWTMLGPVSYGGGTAVQPLVDLQLMMRGGYMADVGRAALGRDVASVVTPFFGLGRDIVRTTQEDELKERVKRLLGLRTPE